MQNNKGFTLIELMVTVLLIAILSAMALPQYLKVVEKQKGTEATTILAAIGKSQERYFIINNQYASDFVDLDADFTDALTNAAPRGDRYTTKSFAFIISGTGDADGKVVASRLDGTYDLERINVSGETCCRDLGGKDQCALFDATLDPCGEN